MGQTLPVTLQIKSFLVGSFVIPQNKTRVYRNKRKEKNTCPGVTETPFIFHYRSFPLYQVRLNRNYWEVDTGFTANQVRLG